MSDLLIRNATIVDGTGAPSYIGDVAIHKDIITHVGKLSDSPVEYKKIIDADGLTLSPGFIDMHSHSDLMQLQNPIASAKIRQGITTELLGQDGLGVAPIAQGDVDGYRRYLTGLLGNPQVDWNWQSFADYLAALEYIGTATNLATLVSHGALRLSVMGLEERVATSEEVNKMCAFSLEAFNQGAFGFSTGLIYPPCIYAGHEELIALAEVTAKAHGIMVVHVRNERDLLIPSINEIFDISEKTGVIPHISHLKVMGKENWGKANEVLSLFEEARRRGIEASFDQYPYPAGSTMLSILIPAHAHAGGPEALLEKLRDSQMRSLLADQMEHGLPGWENIASAAGWDGIIITGIEAGANKQFEGQTLADIAVSRGCRPQDVVFDLLLEERLQVSMVNFSMHEADVAEIIKHPLGMLGTDGLLGGKPHPRAYGSTARILEKYVRGEGIISLEEAIARMTSRPAERLGILDRGLLRAGMKADMVLFDAKGVTNNATFAEPCQHPSGFEYVWVNGVAALEKGHEAGRLSGQVLRKHF